MDNVKNKKLEGGFKNDSDFVCNYDFFLCEMICTSWKTIYKTIHIPKIYLEANTG